jgi:peptide/nickel transport system permease protein
VTTTPDPADLRMPAEMLLTEAEPIDPGIAPIEGALPAGKRRSNSQWADIWRRYRKNKLAVVGLVVVGLLILLALLGPFLEPYAPRDQNLTNTLKGPSAEHIMGTDELGRDLYSGMLQGLGLALIVGLSVMVGSLLLGVVVGAIAGFLGGAWDAVLMRITDIFLAFPYLIGAIILIRALDPGRQHVWPVVLALVVLAWPTTGRLMRGQVLATREAEYVEAARSIGAPNWRIIIRHILPNSVAPVLIYAFTGIGVAIVSMAGLSFLGVGVPADEPEWGRMINSGFKWFQVPGSSYLWIFPSIAIVITTLAFAFVADGLRDSLDPKLR